MTNPAHRACKNCHFAVTQQMPPPEIRSVTVCRWGPPHLTMAIMKDAATGQQGTMNLSGFPIVKDDEWCHQFAQRGPAALLSS